MVHRGESGKQTTLTRNDLFLLVALAVAAFVIRLYFLQFFRVISADGVGYVTAARSLLAGDPSPMTVYGVVYPSLVALVGGMGVEMELAGRLVSMAMGSLLVIPLYLLAVTFHSRRAGIIACLLAIVWDSLRMWSNEVMTQATYITLILTAYYLLWRADRNNSLRGALIAGLVSGLCYLTRPEALVAFAALVTLLAVFLLLDRVSPGRVALLSGACTVGFLFMSTPFFLLVHKVTGVWQLTGKGGMTLADALGEYLGRPDMKSEPGFRGIGFLDVVRQYPDFLRMNALKNLKLTGETMLPLYLWVLAGFGLVMGSWGRERLYARLYLLATFAPLAIIIMFFFVGPEYLQPYLPVLFLWCGNGLISVEEWFWGRFAAAKGSVPGRVAAKGLFSLLTASGIALAVLMRQVPADAGKPYHFSDDGGRYDHKRIGLLLKEHLPAGSRIMTRWGRISYYAELPQVGMPQADLASMMAAAHESRVRFVIIDGMLMGMRPQFAPLYVPLLSGPESVLYKAENNDYRPVPGLRLYLLYKDPSSLGVAVYEVVR